MPLPPIASSPETGQQSDAMTRKAVPWPAIHCALAAVITLSGYSYLGSLLFAFFSRRLQTSSISSDSAGSLSSTTPPAGRLVTKLVGTFAPFSYTTCPWHAMWSWRMMPSLPSAWSRVMVGANRKNGTPARS